MNSLNIQRLLSLLLWVALAWATPSVSDSTDAQPKPTLNYLVIAGQSAPLQMLDSDGRASGIVSDLVNTMVADHYPMTVTHLPFKRILQEIGSGQKTNWVSYGATRWRSPQGKNIVDCEIHRAQYSIATLKENSISPSLQGLRGQSIILMNGFHFPELEPEFAQKHIGELRVNNYQSAFKSLEARRAAAFLELDLRVHYNLNATGRSANDFDIQDFSAAIPPYSIYLSLDPNMPTDMREFLTQRCQQLKKQGFINALHKKYQL